MSPNALVSGGLLIFFLVLILSLLFYSFPISEKEASKP